MESSERKVKKNKWNHNSATMSYHDARIQEDKFSEEMSTGCKINILYSCILLDHFSCRFQ